MGIKLLKKKLSDDGIRNQKFKYWKQYFPKKNTNEKIMPKNIEIHELIRKNGKISKI